MEDQKEESASTPLNQRVRSSSFELQPPHESHAPPQCSERSKNGNPSRVSFQPIFPQDAIVEIFSNLPVGSLVRFKCLSKFFKSLITDPFFIKKHHSKSQNDPAKKRIFFNIWSSEYQTNSIRACSVSAIFKDRFIDSVEVVNPLKTANRIEVIVGSCNGLICIDAGIGSLFLLNPTLRAFKRLPNLGFKERAGCYTVYGFGFDAASDDYKVVRVFCHYKDGCESIVRVYSLRTNCWRRIQNFAFGAPCHQPGIYVDGRLNWSVSHRQETGSLWIIVSFDLAQETYKEVLQPGYRQGAIQKTLGVLNGCLCVLCDCEGLYVDIWVMEEYGKRESWNKLLTMPHMPNLHTNALSGRGITPLHVSENEILLLCGAQFFLYNLKEGTITVPGIHEDPYSFIYQAVSCVESLVSPTVVNQ